MAETKSIYDLALHEGLEIESLGKIFFGCIRVPGGWVYPCTTEQGFNQVFVPYSDEFKPKDERYEHIDERGLAYLREITGNRVPESVSASCDAKPDPAEEKAPEPKVIDRFPED